MMPFLTITYWQVHGTQDLPRIEFRHRDVQVMGDSARLERTGSPFLHYGPVGQTPTVPYQSTIYSSGGARHELETYVS